MSHLTQHEWQYEQHGDTWFRVAPCLRGVRGWLAEAKRGPFRYNTHLLVEEGQAWFEFGDTRHAAIGKLKADLMDRA